MTKCGIFLPLIILFYFLAALEAAYRQNWLLAGYNLCASGLTLFVMLQGYTK